MAIHTKLTKNPSHPIILGRKQLLGKLNRYRKTYPTDLTPNQSMKLSRYRIRDLENFIQDFFEDPENQRTVYHQRVLIDNLNYDIYGVKIYKKITILIYANNELNEVLEIIQ